MTHYNILSFNVSTFLILVAVICCLTFTSQCTAEVIRPYNLDYLDAETMRYYLQTPAPQQDYDVAVLFYAQWCNNCHSFAPIWDKIGRIHHAGSRDSNLIMGLFDCEQDATHMELCNQAGVNVYPTISFLSLSGQVFRGPQKATKRNPHPLPRHVSVFAGNWQYGDSVFDWLRALSAISAWHRAGWGRKLRALFTTGGRTQAKKDLALPLGIPTATTTVAAGSSSTASASTTDGTSGNIDSAALESKVTQLQQSLKETQELATRSATLLNSMLQPTTVQPLVSALVATNASLVPLTLRSDNGRNYTDTFAFLAATGGWESLLTLDGSAASTTTTTSLLEESEHKVVRNCAMEIALDYCTRVSTDITMELLDQVDGDLTEESLSTLQTQLLTDLEGQEPYCVLIESCIQQGMVAEECRPVSCPFANQAACRYLSACFDVDIHRDYAEALQVDTTVTTAAAHSVAT